MHAVPLGSIGAGAETSEGQRATVDVVFGRQGLDEARDRAAGGCPLLRHPGSERRPMTRQT